MAKRLGKISGCQLVRIASDVWAALNEHNEVEATVVGIKDRAKAEAALVEIVYRKRSEIVMQQQNYRCAHCGRIRPLEVHHITHRSSGRDDRLDNLVALCSECHRQMHGQQ